eukprot:1968342-Karenia_brevis.AAC.1
MKTVFFEDVDIAKHTWTGVDPTPEYIVTRDILYADDTVLLGSSSSQMQHYLQTVIACGKR